MKTLDEVIGMAERCTLPYPGDCLNCEYFEDDSGNDCRCKILADALHYLQEYKNLKRTAKVVEHDASITVTDGYKYHRSEYLCGACKKKVLGGDEYCSHCGAKLDWSNDE